ncbi:unnamed protein product [Closterium sp. NIES-65]|nr:unnamed protein product [Closterium sp. NIES-65]
MNGAADGACSLQFDAATATEFLRLQRVLMRQDASRATNADTLSWLFDAAKAQIDELAWRDGKRIRMTTDIRKHVHRRISAFTVTFKSNRKDGKCIRMMTNKRASQPTALAISQQHPEWSKSVLYLLLSWPHHHLSLSVPSLRLPFPFLCRPMSLPRWHSATATPRGARACSTSSGGRTTTSPSRFRPLYPLSCVFLQASQPTALAFSHRHPEWSRSVLYLLWWPHHHLSLSFTAPPQLRSLGPHIACSRRKLSSLSLKLRGTVDGEEEQEHAYWSLSFLKDCSQLQQLKLGRGRWDLTSLCADATWAKSIQSLTIKHPHFTLYEPQPHFTLYEPQSHFTLYEPQPHFTLYEPQPHFTLYEPQPHFGGCSAASRYHSLSFSFYVARLLRFRFPHWDLKPTLSLYGQDRLVIPSLRLASARVAYLNGPATDEFSSLSSSPYLRYSQQLPLYLRLPLSRSRHSFSWSTWLRAIAPKVEVLVVRHGVPIERVKVVWRSLRSLGIVVGGKVCHDPDWEAAVDRCDEYGGGEEECLQQQQQTLLPPVINAPNLKSIFFPTRRP